ncbi:MAG: MBL fold metallo-hydrolase [Pseudomonadota bacterium]
MEVRFWGVRGSIPCPGAHTIKYGGNTLCIEVRFPEIGRTIIIDAGSGIRELGNHILNGSKTNLSTEIFLTHTHWDHIIGLPFFTPIYIAGTRLKIYGPVTYEQETLESVVGGQFSYRYFPVRQAELAANIEYIGLREGDFDIGSGIRLSTRYLNHPLLCLGYRFEYKGKTLCTAYDTEPFRNVFHSKESAFDQSLALEGEEVAREGNRRIEEFMSGADLVVHDAQYTEEEYEISRVGWGHSSIEHAIRTGKKAHVKRLALFHHEPVRTDAEIDELAKRFCRSDYTGDVEVFFAREGMAVKL